MDEILQWRPGSALLLWERAPFSLVAATPWEWGHSVTTGANAGCPPGIVIGKRRRRKPCEEQAFPVYRRFVLQRFYRDLIGDL